MAQGTPSGSLALRLGNRTGGEGVDSVPTDIAERDRRSLRSFDLGVVIRKLGVLNTSLKRWLVGVALLLSEAFRRCGGLVVAGSFLLCLPGDSGVCLLYDSQPLAPCVGILYILELDFVGKWVALHPYQGNKERSMGKCILV